MQNIECKIVYVLVFAVLILAISNACNLDRFCKKILASSFSMYFDSLNIGEVLYHKVVFCILIMSRRSTMLASSIRKIISPVLKGAPKECGVVSITEVEVSEDCAHATVLVSSLYFSEKAIKYLLSSRGSLQKQIGVLGRARVPILCFKLDDRTERGERIDRLLKSERNKTNT
ncbi:MAG: ribosome-binding factor A [Candidatus Peribacteraceae bacterium]|nr:ribosome-binding factor A [Candidatus Peribacteraceae bacterium]